MKWTRRQRHFCWLAFAAAAGGTAALVATSARASVSAILQTESVASLDRLVREKNGADQKMKACEFQMANALPPTFCFQAEMALEERKRTTEICVVRAKRARAISATDVLTDPICLRALEERKRDLEYSKL